MRADSNTDSWAIGREEQVEDVPPGGLEHLQSVGDRSSYLHLAVAIRAMRSQRPAVFCASNSRALGAGPGPVGPPWRVIV